MLSGHHHTDKANCEAAVMLYRWCRGVWYLKAFEIPFHFPYLHAVFGIAVGRQGQDEDR